MTDQVFKKVHADGSETVIKQVKPAFRDADGNYLERDDAVTSIFISSSYGCPYKCTFCHLTENNIKFKNLADRDIVKNVMYAVEDAPFNIDAVKLCFMGMGDPNVNSQKTVNVSRALMNYGYNVQEIDISSVRFENNHIYDYKDLSDDYDVSVRLFYSMHTGLENNRKIIIGNENLSLVRSMVSLSDFNGPVKIHYTPVKGLNDSVLDALSMSQIIKEYVPEAEVRMLEFNPAEGSAYERPDQHTLMSLYRVFLNRGHMVKWQVSKGYPEKAACGMFQGGSK